MPLGAQKSSSAFFLLSTRNKYCHNGGIAFGHQSTAPPVQIAGAQMGWSGDHHRGHGTPFRHPKNA
jgi:hypothetical protein